MTILHFTAGVVIMLLTLSLTVTLILTYCTYLLTYLLDKMGAIAKSCLALPSAAKWLQGAALSSLPVAVSSCRCGQVEPLCYLLLLLLTYLLTYFTSYEKLPRAARGHYATYSYSYLLTYLLYL